MNGLGKNWVECVPYLMLAASSRIIGTGDTPLDVTYHLMKKRMCMNYLVLSSLLKTVLHLLTLFCVFDVSNFRLLYEWTKISFHIVDTISIAMMLSFLWTSFVDLIFIVSLQFCQTMLEFLFLTITFLRALRSLSVSGEEISTRIFGHPEEFIMWIVDNFNSSYVSLFFRTSFVWSRQVMSVVNFYCS